MLTAAVIHLEALEDGQIHNATGRGVHGFWFHHWGKVTPEVADALHQDSQLPAYTLSPLMELPRAGREGVVDVPQGKQVWFRATTLTRSLSEALVENWLPALEIGTEIEIPGSDPEDAETGGSNRTGFRWKVIGKSISADEHPWAGQMEYSQLASQYLYEKRPPVRWWLRFATPTAFHGSAGHFPFPLPNSLVASWLRRWQAYAPIALSDGLPELVYQKTVINAYSLKTAPVQEGKRLTVGCVGHLSFRALQMHPADRAAISALAHYAFFAGSGHRTTQGMGITRLKERTQN